MNKDKNMKLSYYSIYGHRFVLWLYSILTLLISVVLFIIILRLLFWSFTQIPQLDLNLGAPNSSADYSYLADFLGGLIGVVIGFFADSMFISRLQHLKRYKSVVNLLNKELNDVKITIKKYWGVEKGNISDLQMQVLNKVGLLSANGQVIFNEIEHIKQLLSKYSPSKEDKTKYNEIYSVLKEVYQDDKCFNTINENIDWLGIEAKNKLIEIQNMFNEVSINFDLLKLAFSYSLTLNRNKITKLSVPLLESIVTSTDGISTFYNLPRYTFWGEEQGNFARELKYFYNTIETFENNFKYKDPWEILIICKELIYRIDHFQKVTDKSYYQSDICNHIQSFIDKKELKEDDEEIIIRNLIEEQHNGIKITKIKKKNFKFSLPSFYRNYIRYVVKFKRNEDDEKLPYKEYLKCDNRRKISNKFILKFEREKFSSTSFKDLVYGVDEYYDAQSEIAMQKLTEPTHSNIRNLNAFSFSYKYFSNGIKDFLNKELEFKSYENFDESYLSENKNELMKRVDAELEKMSLIFKDITTISYYHKNIYNYNNIIKTKKVGNLIIPDEKISDGLFRLIKKCDDYEDNLVLKISSPIGSYKNRLMQYLYLKLYFENDIDEKFNLFYIDVSKYENEINPININDDLLKIAEINNKNNKKPLLFFDNVREFYCGVNHIYSRIYEFLTNKFKGNYKIIIGSDILYTFNTNQKEHLIFDDLMPDKHKHNSTIINIKSMNIARENESIEFIQNCLKLINSNEKVPKKPTARELYERFKELNFYTLDAFWVKKILEHTSNLTKYQDDILNLYDIGLFKYTTEMGQTQYNELAKSVFMFEYESQHFDTNQLTSKSWKVAREHRSMIDYLVARHYVILLRDAIIPKDEFSLIKIIGGNLNLILPKSINRFIVKELSENDLHNLILFCERYIDIVIRYPKFECQVTYIIRVLAKQYSDSLSDSLKVLDIMLTKLPKSKEYEHYTDAEIRQQLFLYRCIAVALGYLGNNEVFIKYLKTIIPGKDECTNPDYSAIADEINRTFHLDYYGDTYKCLDLNGSFNEYKDEKEKGINALRQLMINIKAQIVRYGDKNFDDGKKTIFILQMVTYCSIIKARDYEIKNLLIDEDFNTPILQNILKLALQHKNDKWFNNENSYISDFLLEVFDGAYKKVKSKK